MYTLEGAGEVAESVYGVMGLGNADMRRRTCLRWMSAGICKNARTRMAGDTFWCWMEA